jgi:cellulose synthase/poly-beta-1,6-N-acetylglucosamine synthase-like glycosyltransferase
MRHIIDRYPRTVDRFFEILIPLSAWFFITMPLWLSFGHPAIVAYFIITFDVYWFYKSFTLGISSIKSYITMQAHTKVDWFAKARVLPEFRKIMHIIIIPEYAEPIHILQRTLDNLVNADIPKSKLIVVLATEEKDPHAGQTADILTKKYGKKFGDFIVTRHPLTIGEVAGKSSNMAYAAKHILPMIKEKNIDPEWTTITSCDADALLHPKYFSYLSHSFITDPLRDYHFYQGAILFYNNIWRIPLPNKFFNTLNSIWNLSVLSQPSRFINFSTYSLSLKTVMTSGFWDIDVIPEDYHLFFKVYFTKGEQVKTKGIFLPVLVDAAESHGFFKTIVNQYEQSKRWAWGVSDIPYIIRNAMTHTEIPFHDRFRRIVLILEHHIFWPANWFVLTLGSSMPPLINQEFSRTVLGHNLAQLSSGILTLSTVFLIIVFIIDWRIKPPRPKEYASWKLPFLYLQWFTLPIISLVLSALPGLDAHTRLMLGKRLEYRVTEKV